MYELADIWASISEQTLRNAWKKLEFNCDRNEPSDVIWHEILDLGHVNIDQEAQCDWFEDEVTDPGWQILSAEEIVEQVQETEQEPELDEEVEMESEPEHSQQLEQLSTNKALEGIEYFMRWAESQPLSDKSSTLIKAYSLMKVAKEQQHKNYTVQPKLMF